VVRAVGAILLALLLIPASGCSLRSGSAASVTTCDAALWDRIYAPYRLVNQTDGCRTVTGVVRSTENVTDGDAHFLVELDAPFKAMLNDGNRKDAHGELVIEIICIHPTSKPDAAASCRGYHNRVLIPAVGDRIQATGTHVFDKNHGWMELHPVSHLSVL
jgi:hypothetical protein